MHPLNGGWLAMNWLETLPRPLRWALFLPVGFAAAVVVDGVLENVFYAIGFSRYAESTGEAAATSMRAFTWALILTFVPAVLSPRPWIVGLVMFVIGLIIRVGPLLMLQPYQQERLRAQVVAVAAVIIAHAVGGALALYLVRRLAAGAKL